MKMHDLHIDKDDLDLFLSLASPSKLEFLYDLYHKGKLFSVKKQIKRLLPDDFSAYEVPNIYPEKSCIVRINENNIIITSSSLKAVRHVAYKFMEDGYILHRRKYIGYSKHRFKRNYKIVGYSSPLCLS
jgi:hypothetical protein